MLTDIIATFGLVFALFCAFWSIRLERRLGRLANILDEHNAAVNRNDGNIGHEAARVTVLETAATDLRRADNALAARLDALEKLRRP